MALAERDVRMALEIVEAAASTQNGTPFGAELLDSLVEAIPAESIEYTEWRFHEQPSFHLTSPCDLWSEQSEDGARAAMALACRSYPLRDTAHATSTVPLRITDVVSQGRFRRTPYYALMMRPFGVEHELKLWLPAPPRQSRGFSLVRAPGRDFGERDRALLRLVRPHLARIRARWAPRPAQLTKREHDVLELLAQGLTNREIGRRLVISPGTVRKHLEHVYEKLGVRSRAGAVAAAFRYGA